MKAFDRRLPGLRGRGQRYGVLIGLVLAVTAAAVAGCGSSGGTPAVGQGGATAIQVLTPVQRGDLVESAMGSVALVVAKGATVAVARVAKQSAAPVAVGQKATLVFFRAGANGQGGMPFGQSAQGAPSASPGMNGEGGQGGMPFGQGGSGQGGTPFGQGRFRGRTTPGTVTAVKTNADGSAAVTIAVKKLPANVSAKSVGFASIQTKVLASNVIIIPSAAIKGSGSSATAQVLSGGKTSTRTVVVGKQTRTESEIVSGLSVGENVVWERSFQRGGFFRNGNSPFPGQNAPGLGGGQSGGGSQ